MNINTSIKDRTKYAIKNEGELPKDTVSQVVGWMQNTVDNKFRNIKTDSDKLGEDDFNAITGNSIIEFKPDTGTVLVDGTYEMDPESFKKQNKVLAPSLNLLKSINGLDDLTDATTKNGVKVLTEEGAKAIPVMIGDKMFNIPAGSTLIKRLGNNNGKPVIITDVIDPKNPNRVQSFDSNELDKAIKLAVTAEVTTYLIPKTSVGELNKKLGDESNIVRSFN